MRLPISLLFLALATAFAQLPTPLRSPAIIAALDSAQTQFLVVAPTLADREIADALRRAAVERGATVFVVASPEQVEASYSYLPSLALLDDVRIRLGQVSRSFIVAGSDSAFLLEGIRIATAADVSNGPDTYLSSDPVLVAERTRLFASLWNAAPSYSPPVFQAAPAVTAPTRRQP